MIDDSAPAVLLEMRDVRKPAEGGPLTGRSPGMALQSEARKPRAVGDNVGPLLDVLPRPTGTSIVVAVLIVVSTFLQVSVPSLMGMAVDCYLVAVAGPMLVHDANPQADSSQNIAGLGGLAHP